MGSSRLLKERPGARSAGVRDRQPHLRGVERMSWDTCCM